MNSATPLKECTWANLSMLETKMGARFAVVFRTDPPTAPNTTSSIPTPSPPAASTTNIGTSTTASAYVPAAILESFSVGLVSARVSGVHFYAHVYTGNMVGDEEGKVHSGTSSTDGSTAAAAAKRNLFHSVKRVEHSKFWAVAATAAGERIVLTSAGLVGGMHDWRSTCTAIAALNRTWQYTDACGCHLQSVPDIHSDIPLQFTLRLHWTTCHRPVQCVMLSSTTTALTMTLPSPLDLAR
jgi:hypothetical protein